MERRKMVALILIVVGCFLSSPASAVNWHYWFTGKSIAPPEYDQASSSSSSPSYYSYYSSSSLSPPPPSSSYYYYSSSPPPPSPSSSSFWSSSSFSSSTSEPVVASRVKSSIVLPAHGNVYPIGFYNVTLFVGQPARPYFLDPDTGSDLTWLQCDAPCVQCTEAPHPLYRPSNDLVAWKDPICASLHSGEEYRYDDPRQCDYEVEYADGGSSLGVLLRDVFPLKLMNRKKLNPRLALGCGYDQVPGASHHPIDGVLGLGKGKSSIVSQLHSQGVIRHVIGHCLSARGGGFFFFGDDIFDSSRLFWTSMSRDYTMHYSPGLAELMFGGMSTGYRNLFVVFDSGSSYTYLYSQAYKKLLYLIEKELKGKPLKEALDDETLPYCWKGRKPFKTVRDVRKYFKPLALSFSNEGRAKTQFEVPPEGYLIISNKGNVCLGILNGTEVGLQNFNVIGDISMQDKLVVYDNEKQLIGWASANCDKVPKSGSAIM